MLNVLLPTTLPIAMSRSPRTVAMTDVATSGSDVPAATMVSPTTSSETPSARANATAASTSRFDPSTSIARPASTISTWIPQCLSQPSLGANSSVYSAFVAFVSRRDCTTRNAV